MDFDPDYDPDYDYEEERSRMVREHLMERGIRDERVLEVMAEVPRHLFVPQEHRRHAYADSPLPIGSEQTISQPYIVAYMTELLGLRGEECVLEVGTGSGYQAAILGLLAQEVHTIERHPNLARIARTLLEDLGFDNIYVHVGDGTLGWAACAPFDAIIVTAAAPEAPKPLLDQLAPGGCLVVPVGGARGQVLERWTRGMKQDVYQKERLAPVAFVPLLGEFGWKQSI